MQQHHTIHDVIARDHVDILRREARQARLARRAAPSAHPPEPLEEPPVTVVTNDRQRQAGAPPARSLPGPAGPCSLGMTATLTSPTFVGRTEELARLAAAGERAAGDVPTSVLIGGEAGVGKTRLVGEVVAAARAAGVTVLHGGCVELGGEGCRSPRWSRPCARSCATWTSAGRDGPRAVQESSWPASFPSWDRRPGPAPGTVPPSAATRVPGRSRGGCSTCCWGCWNASAPNASPPGRRGPALGRPVHPRPARLPGPQPAPRPPAAGDDLPQRRAAPPPPAAAVPGRAGPRPPGRAPGAGRFGPAEVAAQLAGIRGAPPPAELVERIRPLGRQRLLRRGAGRDRRHRRRAVPSLRDTLLARIELLGEPTQQVLRVLAVAAAAVPDPLLAEVAGLGEAELLAGLREAVSAHVLLVDAGDGAYGFRHAWSRERSTPSCCRGSGPACTPGSRPPWPAATARASPGWPPSWPGTGTPPTIWSRRSRRRSRPGWPPSAPTPSPRPSASSSVPWSCGSGPARRASSPAAPSTGPSCWPGRARRPPTPAAPTGRWPWSAPPWPRSTRPPTRCWPPSSPSAAFHLRVAGRPGAFEAYQEAVRLVPGTVSGQARVLAGLGRALMLGPASPKAASVCEEAIAVARRVGARWSRATPRSSLGTAVARLGEIDRGLAYLEEARRRGAELGATRTGAGLRQPVRPPRRPGPAGGGGGRGHRGARGGHGGGPAADLRRLLAGNAASCTTWAAGTRRSSSPTTSWSWATTRTSTWSPCAGRGRCWTPAGATSRAPWPTSRRPSA